MSENTPDHDLHNGSDGAVVRATEAAGQVHAGANQVHLIATVTTPPERRVLPSGDEVVSFGVSVPRDEGGTDAIPIQVGPAPPTGGRPGPGQAGRRLLAGADRLHTGDRVAIRGRLRRRWWEAAGMRRSRIEVSATAIEVIPATPP
jgi:single-strand DNA-binding protein